MADIQQFQSTIRQKVDQLEESLLALPQVDCQIRHYFSHGLYAREITVPKNTVAIGAVHRVDNLVVLSSGQLLLAVEGGPDEIEAPCTLLCKAGTKNAVVALNEDVVWTNFFPNPTNETDVDKLVEMFFEAKASDLLGGLTNRQLNVNKQLAEARALANQPEKE